MQWTIITDCIICEASLAKHDKYMDSSFQCQLHLAFLSVWIVKVLAAQDDCKSYLSSALGISIGYLLAWKLLSNDSSGVARRVYFCRNQAHSMCSSLTKSPLDEQCIEHAQDLSSFQPDMVVCRRIQRFPNHVSSLLGLIWNCRRATNGVKWLGQHIMQQASARKIQ